MCYAVLISYEWGDRVGLSVQLRYATGLKVTAAAKQFTRASLS